MSGPLSERDHRPELMDDFRMGGSELRQAFRHLRLLNRLFAASGPAIHGVEWLWRQAGRPTQLTVLDVGAGSGDVNRRLLRWADANQVRLRIVIVDITAEACAEAKALFRGEERVEVMQRSLFDLPPVCADIVTGSQFLHHFRTEELPEVAKRLLDASRLGAVIADIHRHPVAWAAVWLVTRLSRNRYIRYDGPLSVAKGFQTEDWVQLAAELRHDATMECRWLPMFRYAVMLRHAQAGD